MNDQQRLFEAFNSCFKDWPSSFDVEIEEHDADENYDYFDVTIEHVALGEKHYLIARINDAGKCEMEFTDSDWVPVDMGNVFAYMWFDAVKMRRAK